METELSSAREKQVPRQVGSSSPRPVKLSAQKDGGPGADRGQGRRHNPGPVLFYVPHLLYFPNLPHGPCIVCAVERKLKTDGVAQKYGGETKQVINIHHPQARETEQQ